MNTHHLRVCSVKHSSGQAALHTAGDGRIVLPDPEEIEETFLEATVSIRECRYWDPPLPIRPTGYTSGSAAQPQRTRVA